MRRVVVSLLVGLLCLTAVGPILLPHLAAPVAADSPVDIRGTWTGIYHANIGDFPNSDTWTDEDFSTGIVSGNANGGSYTLKGTVAGNKLHAIAQTSGYTSTTDSVISADGKTMTGSGTDTNGNTGTFTFTRQTPVPSASALAAPSFAASAAPSPVAPGTVDPNPAPGCTFGGFGGGPPPTSSSSDASIVGQIGSQAADKLSFPSGLAADPGGSRGRIFVANALGAVDAAGRTTGSLDVIDGQPRDPADIHVQSRILVGHFPGEVVTSPTSGRVFVAIQADCRIAVIDGRASTPSLITEIDLPSNPDGLAYDPTDDRLFVALPAVSQLLVLGPDLKVQAQLSIGSVSSLAYDPINNWLFVTESPGPGLPGAIAIVDGKTLRIGQALPATGPRGMAVDPALSVVFLTETTPDQVSTFAYGAGGSLRRVSSVSADPNPSPGDQPSSAVLLQLSNRLLVPLSGQGRASLFTIGAGGALTFERSIDGVIGGASVVNDPSTGRTYISEPASNEVVALTLDTAAAAPSIAFVLPGPLDISLAPQDVARSVGITAFIMLLLGAPSPIFNSTLGENRALIERWARRKRPRRLRKAGGLAGVARQLIAWSHTWIGLVLYLLLAALLYAFLDNSFPFENAARTFGTTLFGIAVGTAVSQVPGELYVRRHYQTRGKVHVALWTLILAGACVLITRLTGVQPGYVYGIIGGFTFGIALSSDDQGRMAFRGMSILILVGLAAWFARIPFEPAVGLVSGDGGAVINQVLADIFIGAVQGAAIGLIPLRFLTGETLFAWSRWRWALLWGVAILFFAHVVLYPVSSFTPNPSPTGVWTILVTVLIYSAIALGFWWFFRQRSIRHERYKARALAIFGSGDGAGGGTRADEQEGAQQGDQGADPGGA
jgi:hypothetical protein